MIRWREFIFLLQRIRRYNAIVAEGQSAASHASVDEVAEHPIRAFVPPAPVVEGVLSLC